MYKDRFGSLIGFGSLRLCLNAWPTGSDTIGICVLGVYVLVGGSVSLCRWTLWSYAQAPPSVEEAVSSRLSLDQDVELSAPPLVPCVLACFHVSCHDSELNF